MAKIVICDKCKKELKVGEGFGGSLWGIDKYIQIDLCDECAKDMAEYIGTTIEFESKPVLVDRPVYDKDENNGSSKDQTI